MEPAASAPGPDDPQRPGPDDAGGEAAAEPRPEPPASAAGDAPADSGSALPSAPEGAPQDAADPTGPGEDGPSPAAAGMPSGNAGPGPAFAPGHAGDSGALPTAGGASAYAAPDAAAGGDAQRSGASPAVAVGLVPDGVAVADAFAAPDGGTWSRVSARLDWYRRLVQLAAALPVGALGGAFLWLWLGPAWGLAAVLAAAVALGAGWAAASRIRRSWGYAEGATDLYLTCGVAVRQLAVVPYGRMQVVDVTADLLEQALGIATVRVRTAATTADTRIPGLPVPDAVRLRDRLAARSETFSTGL
ncbi:PH domain-containing protein [Nocardiopsis coralliicola]